MKIEIPMKQWRYEESQRIGLTLSAVNARLYHGHKYPKLKIRRVNQRVVLVQISTTSACNAGNPK